MTKWILRKGQSGASGGADRAVGHYGGGVRVLGSPLLAVLALALCQSCAEPCPDWNPELLDKVERVAQPVIESLGNTRARNGSLPSSVPDIDAQALDALLLPWSYRVNSDRQFYRLRFGSYDECLWEYSYVSKSGLWSLDT